MLGNLLHAGAIEQTEVIAHLDDIRVGNLQTGTAAEQDVEAVVPL